MTLEITPARSEELPAGITYMDVLTFAVVSTSNTRLRANSLAWMRAIHSARGLLESSGSGLLEEVLFDERSKTPWSDEVESFLGIARRSGIINLQAPFLREYHVEEDARRDIKQDDLAKKLEQYEDSIGKIAQIMDEQLGLGRF